jgi:hypothetical protein
MLYYHKIHNYQIVLEPFWKKNYTIHLTLEVRQL